MPLCEGVRATAAFIRLFIRGLAWDSQASGVPFRDTLQTAAKARLTDSARGKVLVGVTAGGNSTTYTLPPLGNISADDLAEVCGNLLDQVDALVAETPLITDDALVAGLLALNPTIRTTFADHSLSRG